MNFPGEDEAQTEVKSSVFLRVSQIVMFPFKCLLSII